MMGLRKEAVGETEAFEPGESACGPRSCTGGRQQVELLGVTVMDKRHSQ